MDKPRNKGLEWDVTSETPIQRGKNHLLIIGIGDYQPVVQLGYSLGARNECKIRNKSDNYLLSRIPIITSGKHLISPPFRTMFAP